MKIVAIKEIPYDSFIYTPQVADNENYLFANNTLSKNCQNLSHAQTVKLLTRIGKNCKVILLGSNRQIDNKYISKYTNGLGVLLDACKRPNEHIKIAAVTLQKVVRSAMAEWAEKLFDTTSKK